ncbi:hypothetical protein ACIPEP_00780 [Curtobacterium sp. NPDC087082]|uniref:DUF7507 domain-containing protein n=1 Tax=Curtobacterium sp. NPDC087082 TaxID=3363966 RepID=UPI00382DD612
MFGTVMVRVNHRAGAVHSGCSQPGAASTLRSVLICNILIWTVNPFLEVLVRRSTRSLSLLPVGAAALVGSLVVGDAALAASESTSVRAEGDTITGPLQNSRKTTFVGLLANGVWSEQMTTAGQVTYPVPDGLGIVSLDGTCVPTTQSPTSSNITGVPVGDGSACLKFRSEVTAEGYFTFRVEHAGTASDNRYLGNGDGSALDLIATTPITLFAYPEVPAASTSLSVDVSDTDKNGRTGAGDFARVTATIKNSGNVRLRDIDVELSNGVDLTCDPAMVDAGAEITCETEQILTQSDIDAGELDATMTGSARTPKNVAFELPEASASAEIEADAVGVTSTTATGPVAAAGSKVSVTTTLRNDGNVTLSDLVASVNGADLPLESATIAPGASIEKTFEHVVTQDEFDAGQLIFQSAATGNAPSGVPVTLTASQATVDFERQGAVSAALKPVAEGEPGVGDEIGLALTITNDGNASVRDLAVELDKQGLAAACDVPSLAPGASIECDVTGTYTVTQADVDAGAVDFAATVAGVDTAGNAVGTEAQATRETEAQAPAVGVTLSPTLDASGMAPGAGDEVALVLSVENTGNVTLTDVAGVIADRDGFAAECPAGPLAPGASIDCTLPSYTLTQDDVDNGEVVFDADVTATGPKRQDVAGADSATVTVDRQHGVVAVTTAALKDTEGAPMAGEKVALEVAVRNSGNVTLREVAAEVDGRALDVACAEGALAPGAEVSCTIEDYELTQADIDSGAVAFEVAVTAAAPGGRTASASDEASVELVRVPSISMGVTSVLDPSEHEVPFAGDTASVAVTIRNTGNVTVTGVRGQVAERDGLEVDCPSDVLAPGESVECEVSEYTLTQADVDRGGVRFDVTAAATGANRERVEAAADTTLSIVRAPAITTAATAELDETDAAMTMAGDTATVRLSVVNAGNVTVRNLTGAVEGRDGMVVSCGSESLAPGESADCTLSKYELTQGDVDAGKVGFDITAGATGANGQVVDASARTGVDIVRVAGVDTTVIGHLSESEHDVPQAGDRVSVGVRAVNTGNTTLTGTRAEIIELADLPVECAADGVAPGAEIECVVPEYVLTQGDIDHGQVTIAAVLDATGAGDDRVNDRDEVRVGLTAKSVLDVTAEPMVQDSAGTMVVLAEDRMLRPGEQVWVRYSVANTGNLVVNAVQHMDSMPAMTVEEAILQPGERTTAMTTDAHVVSDAEAAEGTVVLLGQVKGQVTRADGDTVTDGQASTGQTDTENAITTMAAEQSGAEKLQQLRKPVWVFSTEVRTTIDAEPAPVELAFTGSEITQVAVPASIVGLLGGLVLLLWARRRRSGDDNESDAQARHRA